MRPKKDEEEPMFSQMNREGDVENLTRKLADRDRENEMMRADLERLSKLGAEEERETQELKNKLTRAEIDLEALRFRVLDNDLQGRPHSTIICLMWIVGGRAFLYWAVEKPTTPRLTLTLTIIFGIWFPILLASWFRKEWKRSKLFIIPRAVFLTVAMIYAADRVSGGMIWSGSMGDGHALQGAALIMVALYLIGTTLPEMSVNWMYRLFDWNFRKEVKREATLGSARP